MNQTTDRYGIGDHILWEDARGTLHSGTIRHDNGAAYGVESNEGPVYGVAETQILRIVPDDEIEG